VVKALEVRVPAVDGLDFSTVLKELQKEAGQPLPEDQQAYGMTAGAILPHIIKAHREAVAEVSRLKGLADKGRKAAPTIDSQGVTVPHTVSTGGFLDSIGSKL